jgi:hypothetical protein
MQAAHERAEARSLEQRAKTEMLQLAEIENCIITGRKTPAAERIIELQKQYQAADSLQGMTQAVQEHSVLVMEKRREELERLELKMIEDQILGIPKRVPPGALPKIAPDPGIVPLSHIDQNKVKGFRLTTGRMPSAEEMAKWMRK